MLKKREATGALGYMFLFGFAVIIMITTLYMLSVAKLMTHQHEIDDALADSVLASMVCDDSYYFETIEEGEGILRYKDVQRSYQLYKEAMGAALSGTDNFYFNMEYSQFILYEVSGNIIQQYTFTPSGMALSYGYVGYVKTPGGKTVTKTSAYARVDFALMSLLDETLIPKSRDIYCEMEENMED